MYCSGKSDYRRISMTLTTVVELVVVVIVVIFAIRFFIKRG